MHCCVFSLQLVATGIVAHWCRNYSRRLQELAKCRQNDLSLVPLRNWPTLLNASNVWQTFAGPWEIVLLMPPGRTHFHKFVQIIQFLTGEPNGLECKEWTIFWMHYSICSFSVKIFHNKAGSKIRIIYQNANWPEPSKKIQTGHKYIYNISVSWYIIIADWCWKVYKLKRR